MGDINMSPPTVDATTSKAISISAQIMIVAIVILFFVIAICLFLHMYIRCFVLNSTSSEDLHIVSWRRRMARQRQQSSAATHRHRGLDIATLQSLPLVVYNPKDFKEGLECSVCLSEVSEGEIARLLPKCNHGFHLECIDKWFKSHTTCPLCRHSVMNSDDNNNDHNVVEVQEDDGSYSSSDSSESENDHHDESYGSPRLTELPVFPTNVLFWGNDTQVISSFGQAADADADADASSSGTSSGVSRPGNHDEVRIEIPISHPEYCTSPLPPAQEEPKAPVMTRLRSLKRLLSLGKRVAVAPLPHHGSSSSDVDQSQQV